MNATDGGQDLMPLRWIGQHLMIKGKFEKLIIQGKKRATIRIGKVEVRAKEFYIHSGGRIIAKAELESVEYKKVRDLTDEDARLDGFKNKEELIEELKSYYGKLSDDDIVTIIKFRVKEILNKPEGKYPPSIPPYEIAKLALKHLELDERERKIFQTLVKTKSLRKTAKKHFGRLSQRWRIRRMLSKALSELASKGIIDLKELEEFLDK